MENCFFRNESFFLENKLIETGESSSYKEFRVFLFPIATSKKFAASMQDSAMLAKVVKGQF